MSERTEKSSDGPREVDRPGKSRRRTSPRLFHWLAAFGLLVMIGAFVFVSLEPEPKGVPFRAPWPLSRPWLLGAPLGLLAGSWWLYDRWRWRAGRIRFFATTQCLKCGYDLKSVGRERPAPGVAMPTATCPECGWTTGMIYSPTPDQASARE